MMNYKGSYQILDLTRSDVYAFALACVTCGKPVLFVDEYDNPFFADYLETATSGGHDYVLIHKGGWTIAIEDTGTITDSGQIAPSGSGADLYLLTYALEGRVNGIFTFVWNKDTLSLSDISADAPLKLCGGYMNMEATTLEGRPVGLVISSTGLSKVITFDAGSYQEESYPEDTGQTFASNFKKKYSIKLQ